MDGELVQLGVVLSVCELNSEKLCEAVTVRVCVGVPAGTADIVPDGVTVGLWV